MPQLFIIWLPLIYWGFSKNTSTTSLDANPFLSAYKSAERRWLDDLSNWQRRVGLLDLTALKEELVKAKNEYRALLGSEEVEIQKYRADRKNKQLNVFLDGFNIANAKIKGIGPAKQAVLASYGVDTAADISLNKLLSIPGFGPETSKPLVNWRSSIEKRFVFQQIETESERQEISRLRASTQLKLANLRKVLIAGRANLETRSTNVRNALLHEDSALKLAYDNFQQAKVDLEHLNIEIPRAPQATSVRTQVASSRPPSPASPPRLSTSTQVLCPRCGTHMIKRMARKGRNAGSYFWGCGRYPVCKGTRSI